MRNKIEVNQGDIFNKLTIIKEIERKSKYKRRFLCKCECGNEKEVNLIHLTTGHVKSCGCINIQRFKNQYGKLNPSWKGGKRKETGGYIEIYKPDHPFSRQNGYIKEHRYVMEEHLGRNLLKEENVHHIDGNKENNNLSNLELWSTSQPSGQRVEDKLNWALQIIKLYGKEITE